MHPSGFRAHGPACGVRGGRVVTVQNGGVPYFGDGGRAEREGWREAPERGLFQAGAWERRAIVSGRRGAEALGDPTSGAGQEDFGERGAPPLPGRGLPAPRFLPATSPRFWSVSFRSVSSPLPTRRRPQLGSRVPPASGKASRPPAAFWRLRGAGAARPLGGR